HVAAGDAEEEVRLAELHEVFGRLPPRLRNDPDAKTLRFEEAADHRHTEAWMIDVGIAGDDDDVAAVPAEFVHLCARHGQERRRTETFGPVLGIAEKGAGALGEPGRGGGSAHGALCYLSKACSP